MTDALISVETGFVGPDWVGKYILWNVTANNGCSVADSASGSFSTGKTTFHQVRPSTAERREHFNRNDVVVSVGFDANGNGILESCEKSVTDFGNKLIGKAEYDYCFAKLTDWLHSFGGLVYPQAGEVLDLFTGSGFKTPEYSYVLTVMQTYGGLDDQSCGLGFNETVNLAGGQVKKYVWDSASQFSTAILTNDDFWNQIIAPAVTGMDIAGYYDRNPLEQAHSFTVAISKSMRFSAATDDNLGKAIGGCNVECYLTIYTAWDESGPRITGVEASGNCSDLYDFQTFGDDDANGWASRIQACHSKNYRDAGAIFVDQFELEVPKSMGLSVAYNDLNKLKREWKALVLGR